MPTAATSAPLVFDPYDYHLHEDPYPVYARLRTEDPFHHSAAYDLWVISRHEDVGAALRNDEVFSNAMGVSIDKSAWTPDAHKVMSFLAMDPPRQIRLRKLVSRAFTPRRVRELEPEIQRLTETYLDAALAQDIDLEWISQLAGLLPMDVISQMMGVPPADRAEVRRLADLVVHREDGLQDVPPAGMAASLELVGYYADMIAQRRRQPTDDLTSALLAAELDGDRLDDDEIIAFLFLMVVAGNETTTKLLGNALFHLGSRPDQVRDVFADPTAGTAGMVVPWVEETLRHDTSSQMLARHLRADVSLHGRVAPRGAKVLLLVGSANRDERVFTDPNRYDVRRDRDELSQILSFGAGKHYCLGANLARLEARVVLAEFVRRFSSFDVHADRAVRVHSTNVRGFAELPISVVPR
ncbi:cytochrome P450 [Nocardioides terrisoli]|uniref:cytochrome P450 n=1 Tax=Nocardioides terrisoli TaxID=3388267 RepID=UPI00287BAD67|nr:cytochrome P450 [Nocardioides marmorisolisilvae]